MENLKNMMVEETTVENQLTNNNENELTVVEDKNYVKENGGVSTAENCVVLLSGALLGFGAALVLPYVKRGIRSVCQKIKTSRQANSFWKKKSSEAAQVSCEVDATVDGKQVDTAVEKKK